MLKYSDFDYELIDCGNFRRIEKFGKFILDRPCSQASWQLKNLKNKIKSDFYYKRDEKNKSWEIKNNRFKELPDSWNINIGKMKAQLKFSSNSQVGIFPEQFDNWCWIEDIISKRPRKGSFQKTKVLNTFAYTGMSSLFSSSAKSEVCHLDGAKSAISWAKQNAELSELKNSKIRWICDDVTKFLTREIKRNNFYDGIILDPPAFGRFGKSQWQIQKDLPKLMELVQQVLTKNPLFVILTCHAPDFFSAKDFKRILEEIPQFKGKRAEELELKIPSKKGNSLPSSFGARICR